MRVLCVAEKPSIAKAVAEALCGGRSNNRDRRKSGQFVRNIDFTFDFPEWGRCDVTMTSVAGHIISQDFPSEYGWNNCSPKQLFSAPTEMKMNKKEIAQNISNEARRADKLMIWTDCDREGEYIGWEVVQQAMKYNRHITLQNTYRARFSHLEKNHLLHAARNPVRLDERAIKAVQARQEVDLRTGASFTRLLTELFRSAQCLDKSGVISYGGCQFPTLGFVVDRARRIKEFKSEPFWFIGLTFTKDNHECKVHWTKGNLFDRLITACVFKKCMEIDPEYATVVSATSKPTSNWAPLPLNTVQMQKDCARIFHYTAKVTLDAAEYLYSKGFISYPRTETDTFPKAMDLRQLIEPQRQSSVWGDYARSLLQDPGKYRAPRQGNHSDEAHPPIHPVIFAGPSASLNPIQKTVYEYIVRRFLACCSQDAKGELTSIRLRWGTELFTASGLTVLETNYLDVYRYSSWSSTAKLPKVAPNERVLLTKAVIEKGKTSPPLPLTETELIALMDANGIGTDATIADHIDKIKHREYVVTKKVHGKETIAPTTLGSGLVEGFSQIEFDNISLTKPFLRRKLEEQLKGICEGRTTKDEVLKQILHMYEEAYYLTERNKRVIVDTYKHSA